MNFDAYDDEGEAPTEAPGVWIAAAVSG